jgi:general secretion pathway protein D
MTFESATSLRGLQHPRTAVRPLAKAQRVIALQIIATLGIALWSVGPAVAQQPGQPAIQPGEQQITPNFKDTDLAQIVEAVSAVTRKTFIIDPRVRAQITILSSTPMSPDAFYEVFQSILQVHGFVAMESGNVIKIVPEANLRQAPSNDLPDRVSRTSDEIVTQVVSIKNVSAAQLLPMLRPLVPQYAHLATYPAGNILIISDHANNVNRLMRIIERIDQAGDDSIEVVPLQNASATEIVRMVNQLNTGTGQPDAGILAAKVVADDRSNSVLITGEKSQRLRIKTLVAHLDTPLNTGGDTEVWYLRYTDAEKLAGKLKEQLQGIAAVAGAPPAAGGAAASSAGGGDRGTSIWPDTQTNALVVTGPLKVRRQIRTIVDKLDIRRAQVKVEAILVEMSFEKSAELGFNWIVGPGKENIGIAPLGIFNQAVGGTTIGQIAAAALAIEQGAGSTTVTNGGVTTTSTNSTIGNIASAIPNGATLGGGRINPTGINFVALLRALRGDGHTNIISTPSIVTLDNEEAKIEVAQEVPFLTGQFATTGTGGGTANSVNPFQTIQRQKVGTILKITPQIISEDGSVMLKIDQEASSLAQGTQGAVDLITNKRTLTTKVLVEDGGLIVLGGLVSDDLTEGQNRVPLLGSIPLIGELFKTRNVNKKKTNLMIFIHPVVLYDGVQTAIESNAKYNDLRNQQMNYNKGKVTLLSKERQPALKPLEEVSRFSNPNDASSKRPEEPGVIDTRQPAVGTPPAEPYFRTNTPPATQAPPTSPPANGPALQ